MAFILLLVLGIMIVTAVIFVAQYNRRKGKLTPEDRLSLKVAAIVVVFVVAAILALEFLVYPVTGVPEDFIYFPVWIPIWIAIFIPAITKKKGKLTEKERKRREKLILAGLALLIIGAIAGVLALFLL